MHEHAPNLILASTLAERVGLHKSTPDRPSEPSDPEIARLRLDEWEQEFARPTGLAVKDRHAAGLLERRLGVDGLSRDDLVAILGETAESLERRHRSRPTWLTDMVEDLRLADGDAESLGRVDLRNWRWTGDPSHLGDLRLLAPVEATVYGAVERFRARLAELVAKLPAGSPRAFDPSTVDSLFVPDLLRQLLRTLQPTLALELNVARIEGRLAGETAEERFASFCDRLRQPAGRSALFAEYPVLARTVSEIVRQWLEVSLELLERLSADFDLLRRRFRPDGEIGELKTVRPGMGDRHRGGRAVSILSFGSGLKVVYKPRSLASDVHMNALVRWLNDRGVEPPLRPQGLLDRGDYGWAEFVESKPCRTLAEVERFYQRLGVYMAVFHVLQAIDMHYENLIADGEHPVFVDGETLLHIVTRGERPSEWKPIFDVILESVFRVGMLPGRVGADEEHEGWETGSIVAEAGQRSMFKQRVWEGVGTDELRAGYQHLTLPDSPNRPSLNGDEIRGAEYRDEIRCGFARTYRLILEARAELLADDGPLAAFAGDSFRYLMRATRTYAVLLNKSRHPDCQRDALERDLLFEHLWKFSQDSEKQFAVVPYEIEELHRGVIPLFTTRADSRDLWTGLGTRIPGYFDETLIEQVREKIERMSESRLSRELWFIDTSFAPLFSFSDHIPRGDAAPRRLEGRQAAAGAAAGAAAPEELIEEAHRIGRHLQERAVTGRGARWFCLKWYIKAGQTGPSLGLANAGLDLYNGVTGIALFLAYLADITGEAAFGELADEGVEALFEMAEEMAVGIDDQESAIAIAEPVRRERQLDLVGAFSGWASLVYAFTHLAALRRRPELLEMLERSILPRIAEELDADTEYDVVGGAAGCAVALLGQHATHRCARALELAIRCGDHLVAAASPQPSGVAWVRADRGDRALTGFAHGAAGVAWALLQLEAATGEPRFRRTALDAIAFERSQFSPRHGNWLDRRHVEAGRHARKFHTAWCHGAPGIGLARLATLEHLDDEDVRAEIGSALAATVAGGFGSGHCLCHGDLGNLELLRLAGERLGDEGSAALAARTARRVLDEIGERGWLCGLQLGLENTGLMNGVAGIGYGLLRCAAPRLVPSVLLLEPPRRSKAEGSGRA